MSENEPYLWQRRVAMLEKQYPRSGDPRRSEGFNDYKVEMRQQRLLEAILDQLYVIGDRLATNGDGK